MLDNLNPITEETGQRILDAVNGVDEAASENGNQGTGWSNLKPMTEETGRRIIDAVAQSSRRTQEALDNRIKKFFANNLGVPMLADSDSGRIQNMVIYGRSVQDGTPTPEAPVEIQSVVNPVVTLSDTEGTEVQAVSLPNITLYGIPTSAGGNVTIDGQQYIADYVDVEQGVLVQMTETKKVVSSEIISYNATSGQAYISTKDLWDTDNFTMRTLPALSNIGTAKCITVNDSGWEGFSRVAVYGFTFETKEDLLSLVRSNNVFVTYPVSTPKITKLTAEQVEALLKLQTYYPVTNVTVTSEQLDGSCRFDYPVSLENGWNYVKQQIGDNRDYIYDMDEQSALAYVNSEYAVALAELEV